MSVPEIFLQGCDQTHIMGITVVCIMWKTQLIQVQLRAHVLA